MFGYHIIRVDHSYLTREYKINCVKLSTGKSIGEHLDAAIEERYDIDNGVLLEW